MFDHVWLNADLATMLPGGAPYGLITDGAVAAKGRRIAWIGARKELPGPASETHDCEGGLVTPGLIDCHTHLVFAGNRAGEFERRLEGASYEEIARAGGGILSTVTATRAADEAALLALAAPRLARLMADGVTTVEVKSGYGLEPATELRMLRAARALGEAHEVSVLATLLAAHALPPEFAENRAGYVQSCIAMMEQAAAEDLVDAVDAFCDTIGFTVTETTSIFRAAVAQGLPVKLHADQLSDCGGAALAARFGALSADHLEYASRAGLEAMANAGTIAVLLPGAFYTLNETRAPDIAAMREAGVAIAVATDANPGSSPMLSLLLAMNMACTKFRLTPEEALAGVTLNAARALGLDDRGVLAAGLRCDLAVYRVKHPAELSYWIGADLCQGRAVAGQAL
ncbi:MAG: imidazolonepropionase [Acetobacteraceae bacterium]|nr:imidazolonepropionase [Acetobacteraceae bacterium]